MTAEEKEVIRLKNKERRDKKKAALLEWGFLKSILKSDSKKI